MRFRIDRLGRSKSLLAVLVTAVALALVGTSIGYAALGKEVTLSVDGETRTVDASGSTVGEVLDGEGIDVSERDVVAPGLDEEVDDGTRISVQFARPLELEVDGKEQTHWVTSTDVESALAEIGRRYAGADLSASRGADIDRGGMSLTVVTPKQLAIKVGAKKRTKQEIAGLTVADALDELEVKVDGNDLVEPRRKATIDDGDRITVTKVRVDKDRVNGQAIDFETVERSDSSMFEGETSTAREGRAGARDLVYRVVYRNGEVHERTVVSNEVTREPVNAIVEVGTKERPPPPEPEPAPTTNFASGGTVWDQLAQCESGGNWAINTGNGYYGGLQFNLQTWQAYGGTGLPSEQSRETQIAVATRLRDANGGSYGSWPSCSSQLGLPQ